MTATGKRPQFDTSYPTALSAGPNNRRNSLLSGARIGAIFEFNPIASQPISTLNVYKEDPSASTWMVY